MSSVAIGKSVLMALGLGIVVTGLQSSALAQSLPDRLTSPRADREPTAVQRMAVDDIAAHQFRGHMWTAPLWQG